MTAQLNRATLEDLHSRFQNLTQLNHGAYGQVLLAQCNKTGDRVALKRLTKGENTIRVKNEILAGNILKGIQGIPTFHDTFETDNHIWLVYDYVEGLDLLTHLENNEFVGTKEKTAKRIFKQLVSTLEQVHQRGIAHKDIKLENVMFNQETGRVYLVDFGLCFHFSKENSPSEKREKSCQDFAGSREYAAPELTMSRSPFSATTADVWSLGVTLFAVIFGCFPFAFDDAEVSLMRMTRKHPLPNFPCDKPISLACKDLITKMLTTKPLDRIRLEEIKEHAWFQKKSIENIRT